MTETKQLLERAKRAFDPPSDVMDTLVVRRDRRQRDRRIRAGVLGLAIAIGVGWLGVLAIRSAPSVPAQPPDLPSTPESWSQVSLDPPPGGSGPSFVVAGPNRLVAVGAKGGPATAWTSSDGASWTRTPAAGLDGADLSNLTSGGPGFFATGSDGSEGGDGKDWFWTSEDGVSWNRLPVDPAFEDTLFISAVERGGPGLVAVGSWMGAWHSTDGSTWERASVPPVPPEIYPGDNGHTPQVYLTNVAAAEDRLVAVGWGMLASDGNLDHPVVVVWTSRDGRSWDDVPTPADAFPQDSSISDITAGPDGFVAVGQIGIGDASTPAVWSSPDGQAWHLHRLGPDGLQLSSVAAGEAGYVAVGATMVCDADCASREAVVMTSVDGETWDRVPSGPEFRVDEPTDPAKPQGAVMDQVVAWGPRFAALGEYDGESTVWVTTVGASEDAPAPAPDLGIFAPVAGRIAYEDRDGIWAVDPDAPSGQAAPVQLTSDRATPLAWSPDGSKLLVLREVPRGEDAFPHNDLYVLNAEGTLSRLTDAHAWVNGGSFSPDGTVVIYDTGDAIYAVDAEGGTPRLVTYGEGNLFGAAYSPDGSQIAYFDGSGDHSNTLYVMNPDGSDVRALTGPDYGHIDGLAWSPDGSRLAFSLQGGGIWIVGIDGSGLTELIPDGERVAWSPDGSRISFQRRHGTPVEEVRNGETVEVTYCPCNLGRLEIVTLDGGDIQEFGYAGSGPWNPFAR